MFNTPRCPECFHGNREGVYREDYCCRYPSKFKGTL
jgi:hypothetical protein